MSNPTVKLTGSGAFQDIGTVGQTTPQLAGNIQSINQILDVGLRNTRNYLDSFLRVSDIVGLEFATLNGNILTAASFGGTITLSDGTTTLDGVTKLTFSGATVSGTAPDGTVTISGGGGGTVDVQDSISGNGSSGSPLQLVNDTATPGNNKVYGTNSSGVRGWQSAGGGGSSLELTDGTHTVTGVTQITVSGGTVGGSSPNATLAITGGGGGVPAGSQLCFGLNPTGTNTNWSNYTISVKIPWYVLLNLPTSFKFSIYVNAGTGLDIGHAYVYTTAAGQTTITSVTPVTWGGNPSPTLAAGQGTDSDAIAVPATINQDLYISVYCPSSSNNNSVSLSSTATPASSFDCGDNTGDATSGLTVGSSITGLGVTGNANGFYRFFGA